MENEGMKMCLIKENPETYMASLRNLLFVFILISCGFENLLYRFTFAFSNHLADTFIQSDLQMRPIEAIRSAK